MFETKISSILSLLLHPLIKRNVESNKNIHIFYCRIEIINSSDYFKNQSKFRVNPSGRLLNFSESCADYQRLNPEPDFDRLVARVVEMWTDLGEDGYPGRRMAETMAPLLMVRGDLDPLTSLESMAGLQALRPDVHVLNIPFTKHAKIRALYPLPAATRWFLT